MKNRFDEDARNKSTFRIESEDKSHVQLIFDIGIKTPDQLYNDVMIILFNLANLKDVMKRSMVDKAINPNIVEDAINNSLHLKILLDLVNQDKHGYPLDKRKRSNRNPIIKNLRQELVLAPGTSVTFSTLGGNEVEGKAHLETTGSVFDDMGTLIFSLEELITTCYDCFYKIIVSNKLI